MINDEVKRVGAGHGLALVTPLRRILITGAPNSPFAADAPAYLNTTALARNFIKRIDALGDAVNIPMKLTDLKEKDFDSIATAAVAEAKNTYAPPKVTLCSYCAS